MKLACALIILGAALGISNPGAASEAGLEVITAAEIQSAGLFRLGDILLLADSWTESTRDGFDWQASPNGLSTGREQAWAVMVDGQIMNLRLYDSINLNLLPIPLAIVDSVEIISVPLLYRGVFTDRGLIHIHTRRPGPGSSFLGEIEAGNETGDPGPYAYTGLATPNIDATGPDAILAAGFSRTDAYLLATASTGVHFFRDPAMIRRTSAILGPPGSISSGQAAPLPGRPMTRSVLGRLGFDDVTPGMRKRSASLRTGINRFSGRHGQFAGYTETERYFLFAKAYGREIPVNSRFFQAGLNGVFDLASQAEVSYRLSYSSHRLEKYPNALDADLDWDNRVLRSNIEGRAGRDNLSITGGISWDRHAPHTRHALMDKTVSVTRLYSQLRYRLTAAAGQTAGLSAIASEGRTAMKAFLATDWNINPSNKLALHLSFSERLPEEDMGLHFWTYQGLIAPNDLGLVYVTSPQLGNDSQLTADLTWQARPVPSLTISSTASARFFADLYLESELFLPDSTGCSFSSPVFGRGLQDGTIAQGRITVRHQISNGLSHRLSYSYQTDIGGDRLFEWAWRTVPDHRACYRITCRTSRNVDMWGMLSYRSASDWIDYSLVDGQACESSGTRTVYRSTVDGSLKLDLQIQKWFWQRRLRGELLCRNVWNETVRYHPIGASFDLSFFVGLRLQLGAPSI